MTDNSVVNEPKQEEPEAGKAIPELPAQEAKHTLSPEADARLTELRKEAATDPRPPIEELTEPTTIEERLQALGDRARERDEALIPALIEKIDNRKPLTFREMNIVGEHLAKQFHPLKDKGVSKPVFDLIRQPKTTTAPLELAKLTQDVCVNIEGTHYDASHWVFEIIRPGDDERFRTRKKDLIIWREGQALIGHAEDVFSFENVQGPDGSRTDEYLIHRGVIQLEKPMCLPYFPYKAGEEPIGAWTDTITKMQYGKMDYSFGSRPPKIEED
jgi:hypothetical protein